MSNDTRDFIKYVALIIGVITLLSIWFIGMLLLFLFVLGYFFET